MGFGVWALVIQNLVGSIISVILFWFLSKWNPSIVFSKQSFQNLFGFGSKILLSGLLAQILNNIYNITIGKAYSAAELGFYTRANSFSQLIPNLVARVLHQVSYPILASVQDDKERLVSIFKRMIRMSAFIIFPLMTILAVLADPLVRILLTEKWMPVVPLFQWLCFASIFYPVSVFNVNILNAIGRSDLYLKVDVAKSPLTIIALIVTIPFGVKAMVIGQFVRSIFSFFINTFLPGKLFGYGAWAQLRDMIPVFLSTAITALTVFVVIQYFDSLILKLLIGSLSGFVIYLASAYFLKIKELREVQLLIQDLIHGKV